jgi:hypothetical protein
MTESPRHNRKAGYRVFSLRTFWVKMCNQLPGTRRMRVLALLCLGLAACSSVSGNLPDAVVPPPPDPTAARAALITAASGAKIAEPIEVSDPIRANPNSSSPWLICLRSAGSSEASKRLIYAAFFTDKYVSSRWSVDVDHCGEQVYHPLKVG